MNDLYDDYDPMSNPEFIAEREAWEAYCDSIPDDKRLYYCRSRWFRHIYHDADGLAYDIDEGEHGGFVVASTRGKAKAAFAAEYDIEFADVVSCRLATRDYWVDPTGVIKATE